MRIPELILYNLAKIWPSPVANRLEGFGAVVGTDAYGMAYAKHQFVAKMCGGIQIDVSDLDVLDVGCGHGGTSCFIAAVGARKVIGIDINIEPLQFAVRFAGEVALRFGDEYRLPVNFLLMNTEQLSFGDNSFNLVVADNVFEHFEAPEVILKEIYRVLQPGGRILVPTISFIYSKYGVHLKHGLKLPWANLFFSERTIIQTMYHLANDDPKLMKIYPGLSGRPERVRDLRPYKDLNDMTSKRFRAMVIRNGFEIEWFRHISTSLGKVVSKIPILRRTLLIDIFSFGASACLRKITTGNRNDVANVTF
jgi:ubiquinone/menaquinone biosynthesis C-methylase UbiE